MSRRADLPQGSVAAQDNFVPGTSAVLIPQAQPVGTAAVALEHSRAYSSIYEAHRAVADKS